MAATVTDVTSTAGRLNKVHVFDLSNWVAAADTATITHGLGKAPAYVHVEGLDGLANADADAMSAFNWVVQTKNATTVVLRKANIAATNVAATGARVFVFEELPVQLLEAALMGAALSKQNLPGGLAAVMALR